ncbi:MAG: chromosomal replication initiator protein DnaA [Clostridiales bacterium]|nr:chromosomal replication initiator protein DnaA [Clostridiales bacterium]
MDIHEIWRLIYDKLAGSLNNTVGLNVHMRDVEPVSMNSSAYTISVPLSISKNMIEFRYQKMIEAFLEEITGNKLSLRIIVKGEEEDEPEIIPAAPPEQDPSNKVNPKYTFENFVIGSSNEYAVAAAISATEKPGYIYNPLFLYGNSGLGKTHLMHAVGNRISRSFPSSNIIYVTSESFTNEFITTVRENRGADFRKKYRAADVLLVDDVQFMQNKEATQEEFFHTFNDLYSMNKQIVLTSDRKPSELVTLEERIRQRFSQGLTIDITVPNFETRVAILQKKASLHNIDISNEVLCYIADRIKTNIRELEGILIKLISFSQIKHEEINLALAEFVMKSYLPDGGVVKITPDKIMDKVSTFYNITKEDLTGKAKTKNIAIPRQIAMYLCFKLTDMNYVMIGKSFGNKDRTTAMHNIKKIENDVNTNGALASDINYIIKDLQNN